MNQPVVRKRSSELQLHDIYIYIYIWELGKIKGAWRAVEVFSSLVVIFLSPRHTYIYIHTHTHIYMDVSIYQMLVNVMFLFFLTKFLLVK